MEEKNNKTEKDKPLKIEGSFDDVLNASVPEKPKNDKKNNK